MKYTVLILLFLSLIPVYAAEKVENLKTLILKRDSLQKELININKIIAKRLTHVVGRSNGLEREETFTERDQLKKRYMPRAFREQKMMAKYFAEEKDKSKKKR